MKRQLSSVMLGALLFVTCGCGQGNIFSFAHSAGSNTSTRALSSDASQALQNKDWAKAMQYYSQILQSDPGNSQAIYGYCSAELANSGMDISSLVANLVAQQNKNSSSPSLNRLAPALAFAAHSSATSSNSFLPSDIIAREPAIKAAVNKVLGSQYLLKIIQGKADGTIAPDNVDVNINIAFCLILSAALKVYDSGTITFDSNYDVTVNNPDINVANAAGQDIASAYHRLLVVKNKLNLGDNSMVANINSDVNSLFGQLKTKTGITIDIASPSSDYYYLNGTY